MTLSLKNFRLGARMGPRVCLQCDDANDNRYHVWLDPATRNVGDKLYVNPPPHLRTGDAGYFRTRQRDPEAAVNKPIVAAMLEAFERDGLLAKLEAAERDAEAMRKAANARANYDKRLRDAAPQMFAALVQALECLDKDGNASAAAVLNAKGREIVAKVEG